MADTPCAPPVPSRYEVCSMLRKEGENVCAEDDFHYERIGEGTGFVSILYRIKLSERVYVVKITSQATIAHGEGLSNSLMVDLHDREVASYEWMKKARHSGLSSDLSKIVRYYGGRDCDEKDGMLILEDLSSKITKGFSFVKGYDVKLIYQLVDQIVGLQSAYLSCEEKAEIPDKTSLYKVECTSITKCINGLPEREWLTEDKKEILLNWARAENIEAVQRKYDDDEEGLPLVLCHCDMWPGNLLFTRNDSHPQGELLAVLDWQCATTGVLLCDIAVPLAVCLTVEDRRKHQDDILVYYVEQLLKKISSLKKPIPMTIEKARSILHRTMRFGVLELIQVIVYEPRDDIADEDVDMNHQRNELMERLRALLEDLI